MSFSLTQDQIASRSKSVTRRRGWMKLKEGNLVCAVRKCMGLRKGQTIERLAVLRITEIRREPLRRMLDDHPYGIQECAKEGFTAGSAYTDPQAFVEFFCHSHKGITPQSVITRIAFEYLERQPLETYQRLIQEHLRIQLSMAQAEAAIRSQIKAVGRHWAAGHSPHQVVRRHWPETLQLQLPGLNPQPLEIFSHPTPRHAHAHGSSITANNYSLIPHD